MTILLLLRQRWRRACGLRQHQEDRPFLAVLQFQRSAGHAVFHMLGLPLPLLPIQILWMNLVTDGIPALALAVDPKAPDLMKRRPRRPDARLLDGKRLVAVGVEGLMLSVIALERLHV